ncbi:peptidoglycan bridge formation glycyltransferase FemA/FemB family protein [Rhodobacteraceae bacterium RKSG542]|uniref:lipid II:glycine glycyltransferase FemX n=1 Tax=Pseudovibrio flavus TaxID=2529854 RepID=UPI0012BCA996|nr:peptidoglycan bridge formation glycyltransferase FemA/FemB family protein [Pseudovibrio flavus]MTI16267.1 peptidoglycan bridge formation glycyltransferase FemA/FemB family protein [Pseudovibrio flavus]
MSFALASKESPVLHQAASRPQSSPAPLEAVKLDRDTFDVLSAEFDDVLHEQTASYNDARWGADRSEYVGFKRGNTFVGALAIIVIPAPYTGSGLAIVKWGPLWRKSGKPTDISIYQQIIEHIQTEYAGRRRLYVTVMPRAEPELAGEIEEILVEKGFKAGDSLPSPERYLVNTQESSEELHKALSQKWRYNLKKALKNDFEIEWVEGYDGFEQFMDLYTAMLERKDFFDHSAIYTLDDLMQSQSDAIRPRIMLVSHEGEVVAGAVVDMSGDTAIYLYGATNNRALPLKAGFPMHWEIAKELCDHPRIKWYDLGGTDQDAGLEQFKKGFVGKSGRMPVLPPNYHYTASIRARLIGELTFQIKRGRVLFHKLRRQLKGSK